jgi:hypothetical protein
MKCRPGDLAVVIAAVNESNIGLIVRVLRPYDKALDGRFNWTVPAWIVEGSTVMIWANDEVTIKGTIGPALDEQLRPIRGPEAKPTRARYKSRTQARQPQRVETV